jgi:mono/diheme cytochrome c family protein
MTAKLRYKALASGSIVLLASVAASPFTRAEEKPIAAPEQSGTKVEYNRDIRPIFAENCFACHGPDSAARKGDLRIDRRDDAVKSGAITPGNLNESKLIDRICSEDADEVMPPPKTLKKLTAAQKETLKRWIASGAEYQAHWSFIAPVRPAAPKFDEPKAKAWIKNPIDAFIYAKLKAAGLEPAPEADRRTLARRLSLDLTGLPPEPADVEAFANDQSPDWYEKYVDRLMAMPQWGEHRGRYWLDAARYGDTHGIHIDNFREIWAYRDWVIKAFNKNQPFDQFTIEQLAGDLLPNPTLDQKIATGFNRCNITTSEGGAINEEYLVLYARDRTETVNQVWMGLTAGCAVCHDHKFDPISQRDFYSMSAFFNNTTQAAMDGNVQNTPPIIPVPRAEDRPRLAALTKDIAAAQAKLDSRKVSAKADYDTWLKAAKPVDFKNHLSSAGLVFHAPLGEGKGNEAKVQVGGKERTLKFKNGYDWSVERKDKQKAFVIRSGDTIEFKDVGDFDRTQPFAISTWVQLTKRNTNGAIVGRMDEAAGFRGWDLWVQNDRIGMHVINTYPQDAVKVVSKNPLPTAKWIHVTAAYDGTGKSGGIKIYYDGEAQPTNVEADTLKSTTRTTVPLKIGQRNTTARVNGVAIQDLRIYDRPITAIDAKQLAGSQRTFEILAKAAAKRTPAEAEELFTWWLVSRDKPYQEASAAVRKLQDEETAIKARGTIAHIAVEKPTPPEAFILYRGDYDKRRDKVGPLTPKALPAFSGDQPKNRLGFARWLLRPDHPLTARVTVNRFWQEVFGTGLVKTAGDFGISGDLPSHPELLDWLAIEFRENRWDVKQFFKMIVTSSTYRQAAAATKEKLDKDRDNRLLSRGPRYRMDGEMIRDYALAASGLLVKKIGGPSVKPYQPDGVWEAVAMIGSNTRDYKRDSGENLYRRSMYTFWKRSAPPASMEIFNAPNRETCTVRRERTNTPIQALVTLNDVQFVESARVLAEKTLKEGGTTAASRLDFIARRLLARPFTPQELRVVEPIYNDLYSHYQAKPEQAKKLIAFGESKSDPALDAATLAAYTMVVNEVLNLDEVLNK